MDASPLVISVATTCAATVATVFLGLLAAWSMYRAQMQDGRRVWGLWGWGLARTGLKGWIDGMTLPLVLPPTVVGFFLLLIFGRRSLLGMRWNRWESRLSFPGRQR